MALEEVLMKWPTIWIFLWLGGTFLFTESCLKNYTTAALPPTASTPTPTSTAATNSTPTPSKSPTSTTTAIATATPTPTPSLSATSTATNTPPSTNTPTGTPTSTPSSTPGAPPSLILNSGVTTLTSGAYTFSCVNIASGAVVTISGGVTIFTQCFTLNGTITGAGQGYPFNTGLCCPEGPGGGGLCTNVNGCDWPLGAGGGHGGAGGDDFDDVCNLALGGAANDNAVHPANMGSAGGLNVVPSTGSDCSSGGGLLWIIVYNPDNNSLTGPATVNGTIDMSGANQCFDPSGDDGGGAGGSILLEASSITGGGQLLANGGAGGGGGGGGIISFIETLTSFAGTTSVQGGGGTSARTTGCTPPSPLGSSGVVTFTAAPSNGY